MSSYIVSDAQLIKKVYQIYPTDNMEENDIHISFSDQIVCRDLRQLQNENNKQEHSTGRALHFMPKHPFLSIPGMYCGTFNRS